MAMSKIKKRGRGRIRKKRRGRPPGRQFAEPLPVRLTLETFAAVDNWAVDKDLSRSEAVRQLVERGLRSKGK